jgi:uncharacterized membrane protein YoaT (DUF817 family)
MYNNVIKRECKNNSPRFQPVTLFLVDMFLNFITHFHITDTRTMDITSNCIHLQLQKQTQSSQFFRKATQEKMFILIKVKLQKNMKIGKIKKKERTTKGKKS